MYLLTSTSPHSSCNMYQCGYISARTAFFHTGSGRTKESWRHCMCVQQYCTPTASCGYVDSTRRRDISGNSASATPVNRQDKEIRRQAALQSISSTWCMFVAAFSRLWFNLQLVHTHLKGPRKRRTVDYAKNQYLTKDW